LQDGLRSLADHPLVGEVRGIGLIAGLEIVRDKRTKEGFDPAARIPLYLEERCAAHGVLLRAIATTLAISPPLIVSVSELREIVRVIGVALDETRAFAAGSGLL
jgi:4-aminobutyrate--pyruvate transaminase